MDSENLSPETCDRPEVLRDRVVTASSPWIASEYSPYSEDESFERAVLAEGLQPVLGTCRSESAACRLEWRNAHLIESDENYKGKAQHFPDGCDCLIHLPSPFPPPFSPLPC